MRICIVTWFLLCSILTFGQVVSIDIDAYKRDVRKVKLSEIATDSRFIKLETKPECLIGRVSSVKRMGDKIFVSSSTNEFLVFDTLGTFITKIGKKGKGPGEYNQVFGVAINYATNHIFVLDNAGRKIIEYGEDGGLIREIENRVGASDIFSLDDKLYYFTASRYTKTFNDFHIHYGGIDGVDLKSWHKRKIQKPIYYTKETVYRNGDEVVYWQNHWDTVYGFNGEKFYPKYYFNLGKNKIPQKFIIEKLDNRSISKRDPYVSVSRPIEFESLLFVFIVDVKRIGRLITFEKEEEKGYCIDWDKSTNKWGFIDDISGIPIFSIDFRFSDNEAACAHEILDLKKYYNDQIFNVQPLQSNRNMELIRIIEESEVTDNPIIQIVTLK